MSQPFSPARPPTPQVLLHRLPVKPDASVNRKPSKFIVLITGSTLSAGKLQIAKSVAEALACPVFHGESQHESSAKAAALGAATSGPNGARYKRMWLSKLTRTGLLFPEESRAATEGFSGFGGATSSTSTSRRGSASSTGSVPSSSMPSSRRESSSSQQYLATPVTTTFLPGPSAWAVRARFTESEAERRRRENPALMVVSHPELETWHKLAIRESVGDYNIGVVFVPLDMEEQDEDEDEDYLPILRPLDPRTMTSFPVSFDAFPKPKELATLDKEMRLRIDASADVSGKIAEIIDGVQGIMGTDAAVE